MIEGKFDPDELLTSSQVGALLQVNPSSIKNWVNDGLIAAFRTPGGHRRIRATDLVAFLDSHQMPIPRRLTGLCRRRLLVVDDDRPYLTALSRRLKSHPNVQLELASNGIDALVMIGSFKPHLVILDVYMPELDGIEVCRRLKANPATRNVGVVLVSSHMSATVEKSALDAGARICKNKPIDIDAVLVELGPLRHAGS